MNGENELNSDVLVASNKTNFNFHISRSKGRSKKGSLCTSIAAGSKEFNIHVIRCIGNMGVINH